MSASLEQKLPLRSVETVQAVSKLARQASTHSKSDVRYWQQRIVRPTYTRDGKTHTLSDWVVKVQFGGRRETIPLATPNKAAAAAKAKEFYHCLLVKGWTSALATFKPKAQWSSASVITVGDFISAVEAVWSGKSKTLHDYARSFRQIASQDAGIDLGSAKYDYRTGGRERWVQKVNAIKLRDITPNRVQKWKVEFLKRAGHSPAKKRAASISVNSLLRQAKSLFAPSVLKFVKIDLPSSPFEGVAFEPRQSMRYQSSFNVEQLIHRAQTELPQEQFKIFLLAVMAGLRRNEIDKLEWTAFDWDRSLISIRVTDYFSPKSEDSIGDVETDSEVIELFRGYFARPHGQFVIESDTLPKPNAAYSHYRCERLFQQLGRWLRDNGVAGNRPLHTLRKEYGSQVCAKHGIYAASLALRHADIAITSQHYLDKRQRMTVGLGSFLTQPTNVAPFAPCKPVGVPRANNLGSRRPSPRKA